MCANCVNQRALRMERLATFTQVSDRFPDTVCFVRLNDRGFEWDAAAGLLRCTHCGETMEPLADPPAEHYRRNPSCPGNNSGTEQTFAADSRRSKQENARLTTQHSHISQFLSSEDATQQRPHPVRTNTLLSRTSEPDLQVDAGCPSRPEPLFNQPKLQDQACAMSSVIDLISAEILQQLKEMNFTSSQIDAAAKHRHVETPGSPFPNIMSAVEIILEMERPGQASIPDHSSTPAPSSNPGTLSNFGSPSMPKPCSVAGSLADSDQIKQSLATIQENEVAETKEFEVDVDMSESDLKEMIGRVAEANEQIKDAWKCKVCMDEDINIVLLSCGHLVCCAECAAAVTKCPLCRQVIRGTVRIMPSNKPVKKRTDVDQPFQDDVDQTCETEQAATSKKKKTFPFKSMTAKNKRKKKTPDPNRSFANSRS